MKRGSTTNSQKPRKRARNGAIPPHQNRKNSAHNHLRVLFWDEQGVILEYYIPRGNTVISAMYADLKNHLHPAIKSKWRGCLSTGVLLQHDNAEPPYCQFSCCNNPRSVLWVSSTSTVLTRPHRQWLSCLWTAQRGDWRQVFQVQRRGAAGGAWVAALSAKRIFF